MDLRWPSRLCSSQRQCDYILPRVVGLAICETGRCPHLPSPLRAVTAPVCLPLFIGHSRYLPRSAYLRLLQEQLLQRLMPREATLLPGSRYSLNVAITTASASCIKTLNLFLLCFAATPTQAT